MNKKVFLVVMAALLSSKGLLASEQPKSFTGEEMVVTATKTLNRISDAGGASVTVISSADIQASGKETVGELLLGVAGIDITSNGGIGSQSSIFIRGGEAKNTLVLIDGIAVNDPSTISRTPNISNITLDNVAQVEIVRGPMSVLYGSNATAGVINIITVKGSGPMKAYAGIEGGAYGTRKVYGGINGKSGKTGYALTIARLETDGFSAADNRNARIPHNGNTSEKDGYSNSTLSGSYSYEFSPNSLFESTLRYSSASVKYDENANGYSGDRFTFNPVTWASDPDPSGKTERHGDNQQYSWRGAYKHKGAFLASTLFIQYAGIERNDYSNDGDKETRYTGNSYEGGWQGDLNIAASNTLTLGLSGKSESMTYNAYAWQAPAIDRGVLSWNAWAEDQWSISGVKLVGGFRYEGHEMFGHKLTGRIAPSYTFGNTVVKASYGTGFLSPTLYQLYSEHGLSTLKPETSRGWDGGVEHKLSESMRAGATWFETFYNDRIDYDSNAGPLVVYSWGTYPVGQYYQPEGESKSRGIESFIEWAPFQRVLVTANYTAMNTTGIDGTQLVLRPKHKAGLIGTWKISEKATLASNMQWVGKRKANGGIYGDFDKDGNPVGTLDSYFVVNLSGSCKISDTVELSARIDNLFDNWYETVWSYATPGRSAYAGIKVTF